MKIEEIKKIKNISVEYNGGDGSHHTMERCEMADEFVWLVMKIQDELVNHASNYGMNMNLNECKEALEKIASLVSCYRFKTETGIQQIMKSYIG